MSPLPRLRNIAAAFAAGLALLACDDSGPSSATQTGGAGAAGDGGPDAVPSLPYALPTALTGATLTEMAMLLRCAPEDTGPCFEVPARLCANPSAPVQDGAPGQTTVLLAGRVTPVTRYTFTCDRLRGPAADLPTQRPLLEDYPSLPSIEVAGMHEGRTLHRVQCRFGTGIDMAFGPRSCIEGGIQKVCPAGDIEILREYGFGAYTVSVAGRPIEVQRYHFTCGTG